MIIEDLVDRKKTVGQEIVVRANRGSLYRVKFDDDGYATSVRSVSARSHREILAGKKPGLAAKCAVQAAVNALKAWRWGMVGAVREKGDRERGVKRLLAAPIAALAIGLNVSAPARADEAMIEGCLKAAAEVDHVSAGVLVLLISVEAGRLGEVTPNINDKGVVTSVDIGPMQVNDTWLGKIGEHWGASRDETYRALRDNFCANVEGGAWILRQALDEAGGDLWEGVALYHSHTPVHKLEYMRLVYDQAMRLKREAGREATQGVASADARGGR